jgi:two-component system, NtrC family, sensor kinase
MPVRVLLVDDEPQVLAALRRVLARRGFEVMTAPDAESALQQLPGVCPDVVISDFRLPGLNGVELLNSVSKLIPNARRALLSGYADLNGHTFEGTFLRKPWDTAELVAFCASGVSS